MLLRHGGRNTGHRPPLQAPHPPFPAAPQTDPTCAPPAHRVKLPGSWRASRQEQQEGRGLTPCEEGKSTPCPGGLLVGCLAFLLLIRGLPADRNNVATGSCKDCLNASRQVDGVLACWLVLQGTTQPNVDMTHANKTQQRQRCRPQSATLYTIAAHHRAWRTSPIYDTTS